MSHLALLPVTFEARSAAEKLYRDLLAAPSDSPLESALAAECASDGAKNPALGFSGGLESRQLARAFLDAGKTPRLLLLSTDGSPRDRATAENSARELGLALEKILVNEDRLRATISAHRELLAAREDYTQRILAVCELLLADAARAEGEIATGHGPEAVLGGFRRRATPSLDDPERILETIRLNTNRISEVACAVGIRWRLPFLAPKIFTSIVMMRRAGAEKRALSGDPETLKSSLQNGSGVHYLFARMARREGHRYVRDLFERLVA